MPRRSVPLIVIASASTVLAHEIAVRLRRDGKVVYVTHSPEGCLRVATSVMPDIVLLDPRFPPRIERLLRVHPSCAGAQILHLSQDSLPTSGTRIPHAA
jgi:hypothetical protein